MAIYLKLGDIKGNTTDDGYQGWIKLNTLKFGVERNVKMIPGNIRDREHGIPKIHEIFISKDIDQSTIGIVKEAFTGKACGSADLHFVHTGGAYLKYKLGNVIVSNYDIYAHESDNKPQENIALNFTKMEMTYTPTDSTHTEQSPATTGYDLETSTLT